MLTPPQKSEVKFNPNVNIERYVRKGDRKTFFLTLYVCNICNNHARIAHKTIVKKIFYPIIWGILWSICVDCKLLIDATVF